MTEKAIDIIFRTIFYRVVNLRKFWRVNIPIAIKRPVLPGSANRPQPFCHLPWQLPGGTQPLAKWQLIANHPRSGIFEECHRF